MHYDELGLSERLIHAILEGDHLKRVGLELSLETLPEAATAVRVHLSQFTKLDRMRPVPWEPQNVLEHVLPAPFQLFGLAHFHFPPESHVDEVLDFDSLDLAGHIFDSVDDAEVLVIAERFGCLNLLLYSFLLHLFYYCCSKRAKWDTLSVSVQFCYSY